MVNYNNKKFKSISNSDNGEIEPGMVFNYMQNGKIVTCDYSGKNILYGHLTALADENAKLDMRYHQISNTGEIMTGKCISTPEIMANGKIRLYEKWQWTSGDLSHGSSILEEI